MREEAFSRQIPPGMNRHDYVRFRFRQALVESEGFDLVAMGRPEGSGCYCFANDLLGECMQQLEREYRFVVIDSEAGMEHISRGTIGKPDMLLIVSDPGARGMRTVARIREIATQLGLPAEKIFVVLNRYKSGSAPVDMAGHETHCHYFRTILRSKLQILQQHRFPLSRGTARRRIAVRGLAEKIREMAKMRNRSF